MNRRWTEFREKKSAYQNSAFQNLEKKQEKKHFL